MTFPENPLFPSIVFKSHSRLFDIRCNSVYISHNLRTNKLFINSIEMMHGLLGFLLLQSLKNTGNLNGNS